MRIHSLASASMFATLGTVIAIVVVVRFVWGIVADLLNTPAWTDPRKNGQNQREVERELRNRTLGWDKHPRYRRLP